MRTKCFTTFKMTLIFFTFICAEVQVLVSVCIIQDACVCVCVCVCVWSLVCMVGNIYVYVDTVFGCGFLLLFFFHCIVGCFSMLVWTPAVFECLIIQWCACVFCVCFFFFVFAPVKRIWACFTWKGALEICSLLVLLLNVMFHRCLLCNTDWWSLNVMHYRFLVNTTMDCDLRKWATEGLAYLSLDAEVKEELVNDTPALKSIFDLAKVSTHLVCLLAVSQVCEFTRTGSPWDKHTGWLDVTV